MIDITPILLGLILVVGSIATAKVIPLIMTKTTNEQRQAVFNWVTIACKAADQLVNNGTIQKEDRKNHVMDFLNSKGITYDQKEVNEMIESVVLTLPPLLKKNDPR